MKVAEWEEMLINQGRNEEKANTERERLRADAEKERAEAEKERADQAEKELKRLKEQFAAKEKEQVENHFIFFAGCDDEMELNKFKMTQNSYEIISREEFCTENYEIPRDI